MMRQRSLRVFAGLLFVLLSSCGGEETAPSGSESPSPAATSPAPATPVAQAPTAQPTQAQKPTSNLPPPPGLIKSTDPDRRLQQQSNNARTNPFVPPVPVPIASQTGTNNNQQNTSKLPKLPEQSKTTVASLPELPVGIGPEQLPPKVQATQQRNRPGSPLPEQGGRGVPGLPELPVGIGPEQLPPRARPQGGSPGGRETPKPPGSTGGNGNQVAQGGQGGTQRATTPQPPSLPKTEDRAVPSLPDLPVAIGPKLPPKAQNGNDVPRVPTQPERSVPSLPDLPVAIGPATLPPPPEPAVAAAPPQPDIARAVEVTGVVQVGSQTRIIVKAPDEPSSRYVQVGQRLSNGRVLVKRLEQSGGQPIVILEENGIEVAKAIGEVPTASAATPTS
jgi:hypothetical protein